jgi:hypothetical protein
MQQMMADIKDFKSNSDLTLPRPLQPSNSRSGHTMLTSTESAGRQLSMGLQPIRIDAVLKKERGQAESTCPLKKA